MKFFVYIADAKVDRLLATLTNDHREALARELEVDVEHLHALEVGRSAPDEVRFARATALGLHLERTHASRPLGVEALFISDRRALHWGRLRRVRGAELVRHETESPVAFACSEGPRELIMMGPPAQLLAQPPSATVDEAQEFAREPMQLSQFARELDPIDRRSLQYLFDGVTPPNIADVRRATPTPPPWMPRLARLRYDMRALPARRLEFLAKPLAAIDVGVRVVLAAPIYVAMVL